MPIYIPTSEENFASLHDNIINNTGGFTTQATAQGLVISMRMFHGDIAVVQKENPTMLKVPIFF